MIRVLHMIGSLNIGGSQAMIMNLYRNIDREQIQFDFIVDHPEQLYFAEEVESLGGKIFFMPEFTGINLLSVKKSWNNFFKRHPEYKILHSHVRSYASVYLPIAKKHGLKTIVHSHSTTNGTGILSAIKKIMQYPLRYQSDYLFGCSQASGEWLFGKSVVNSNKYYNLKNAVDVEKYKFNPDVREKYRNQLGLENKKTYIHVGRFHPSKNHIFLLEIFTKLCKKEDAVLLLVGDGGLNSKIKERVNELKLNDSVLFLGIRDDIPELFQAADCFVFPSLWEGLPVVAVEAQSAGMPCFISETITNEVTLTDLVKKLSITDGVECWVKAIEECDLSRRDRVNDIKNAGFDIEDTSKWITEFYESIYN